jgi:hypothetical protein
MHQADGFSPGPSKIPGYTHYYTTYFLRSSNFHHNRALPVQNLHQSRTFSEGEGKFDDMKKRPWFCETLGAFLAGFSG